MARPRKNYGINGKKAVLKNLKNVMEAVGQKYSIRVGVIGEKAYEKHPDTDLTNAQLGAVHEFGADIKVTPKMRAFLHYLGIHLKKETTHIKIPERSFLRKVLFDKNIQNYIYDKAGAKSESSEAAKLELLKRGNADFMDDIAETIGAAALEQVQIAFNVGGQPEQWQPITQFTKEHRINDPKSPPLNDTGSLYKSITVDVKRVK